MGAPRGGAVVLLVCAVVAQAQEDPGDATQGSTASAVTSAKAGGIVFLRLRFKADGMLELVDAQVRAGRLKSGLTEAHDFTLR